MQSIVNAVLNTVFVSIPESIIWVLFVLFLLKRNDLLDIYRWKDNLKQIMIAVIPVSISINLMRYILHIGNLINFIIIEVMMILLITYIIKKNNFLQEKINYLKIVIYVLLADFILIFITEGLLGLIVIQILNMNIETINNNILLNIVLSFIPRSIQILLISFCIYKQNIGKMINYIELIIENKVLSISMSIFLIMVIISNAILDRFILGMNYLNHYIIPVKISITVIIILIPIIMISSYIISIYNLLWINLKIQKEKDNMLNDIY
ncbi:MAG: hypothetical protein LLF98_02560 [Clostridium sp.]|uniref:hypothetical protein n=1 Tax=Clostridium sp. TaxID=1506 RepID=UPI0025C6AC36|nr:hypothetical protein [Clostridium sp.]MCE5220165.1 hypothetical protein [Clostridium sp.]